jgi:hypothetical protein
MKVDNIFNLIYEIIETGTVQSFTFVPQILWKNVSRPHSVALRRFWKGDHRALLGGRHNYTDWPLQTTAVCQLSELQKFIYTA